MNHARPRRRRTTRLALVATLVWLLGIELLPGLHVALHARLAPHHHDGDVPPRAGQTPVVRVSHLEGSAELDGRWHDDGHGGQHQHGATGRASLDPAHEHAKPPPPPGHGAHSLAHRTELISRPARPITQPPRFITVAHWPAPTITLATSTHRPPPPSARGPPAVRRG